jgi:hypothetical protein
MAKKKAAILLPNLAHVICKLWSKVTPDMTLPRPRRNTLITHCTSALVGNIAVGSCMCFHASLTSTTSLCCRSLINPRGVVFFGRPHRLMTKQFADPFNTDTCRK